MTDEEEQLVLAALRAGTELVGEPLYFNEWGDVIPPPGHAPKMFVRDGKPVAYGEHAPQEDK